MVAKDGPAEPNGDEGSGGLALAAPPEPGATAVTPAAPARATAWRVGGSWLLTRILLVLMVTGVLKIAPLDVTTDVSVIYHGWYEVLQTGTFPMDDVTWQYPPAAALVVLAPGLLPWSYLTSFFVLCGVFDTLAMGMLLRAGLRRGRSFTGAWIWVIGVPLLGPTVYCRYDILVTAVAMTGLLVLLRRPVLGGILLGFGGMMKVWPLLGLAGTPRGRRTRRSWTAAVGAVATLSFLLAAGMNGAFQFLTFQADRGIEVESLGALPLHFAKMFGWWNGSVTMNYGSVEFLGPWVQVISKVVMGATVAGFCWLLYWRLRARRWQPSTLYDAALATLLIFTVTSRVISPQYLVWLVGLAAVCLTVRGSSQRPVAVLILVATMLTTLEFPMNFGQVVNSLPWGVTVLTSRNLVLLAATIISCRRLWRSTRGPLPAVAEPALAAAEEQPAEQKYPVRPGIAYEQDLLDDIERG
ncbi:glycosyltransferase 87 family protein [Kitasatospora sp. LaBMicrA B282]|uniref:glycosyltransferase 87 family protein n=1 Tax=Kitasatospora sp. LaBMicrA B282 TaxID=3420949 RepID=UPI003D1059A6